MTKLVLTANDGKCILYQKPRFNNRFGETVTTSEVLTENDKKQFWTENVLSAIDLAKQ